MQDGGHMISIVNDDSNLARRSSWTTAWDISHAYVWGTGSHSRECSGSENMKQAFQRLSLREYENELKIGMTHCLKTLKCLRKRSRLQYKPLPYRYLNIVQRKCLVIVDALVLLCFLEFIDWAILRWAFANTSSRCVKAMISSYEQNNQALRWKCLSRIAAWWRYCAGCLRVAKGTILNYPHDVPEYIHGVHRPRLSPAVTPNTSRCDRAGRVTVETGKTEDKMAVVQQPIIGGNKKDKTRRRTTGAGWALW